MKTINFKFGPLYMEEWGKQEEEERVKLYDSRKRYLDYFSSDTISRGARFEKIPEQQWINNIILDIENIEKVPTVEDLLDFLGVAYELITTDIEEVRKCLEYEPDDTIDTIENNDFVNRIGDYYIVVSEYL